MRILTGIAFLLLGVGALSAEEIVPDMNGIVADIQPEDFVTRTLGRQQLDGHTHLIVQAQTRTWSLSDKLGYCEVRAWYDMEDNVMRQVELIDENQTIQMTIRFKEFFKTQGTLHAGRVEIEDHRKGETKVIEIDDPNNPKTMI